MTKQQCMEIIKNLLKDTDECIEWPRGKDANGYGMVTLDSLSFRTHRLAFCWFHSETLIQGNHVLHKCDNPSCLNVKHLFQGTDADNIADMVKKHRHQGWIASGELNANSKLTDKQIEEIKESHKQGVSKSRLAKLYKVNRSHISRIISGTRRLNGTGITLTRK